MCRPHYPTFAEDRTQETMPPAMGGYCECCGKRLPEGGNKRDGQLKFCPPTDEERAEAKARGRKVVSRCRRAYRDRERAAASFIYGAARDARLFKHSNPERANAARAALADWFADHFEGIDAQREAATALDGEDRMTMRQIRKLGGTT